MDFPASTGQVARLLSRSETQLAELVRRGRLSAEPPVLAGRRLWEATHVLEAARVLGALTSDLMQRLQVCLDEEEAHHA